MCDVCRSERVDYRFRNGERRASLYTGSLYNIFSGHLVKVKLCFIHDTELYLMGESRFARRYPQFILELRGKKKHVQERNLPFGQNYESSPRIIF